MTLQLADGPGATTRTQPYIFVPAHLSPNGKGTYVREDYFDNLAPADWSAVMDQLGPYNSGMSGLFDNWKANRQRRKDARNEKRELKNEILKTTGQTGGGRILDKITGAIGGIIGGGAAGAGMPQDAAGAPGTVAKLDWMDQTNFLGVTNKTALIGVAAIGAGFLAYKAVKGKKSRKRK